MAPVEPAAWRRRVETDVVAHRSVWHRLSWRAPQSIFTRHLIAGIRDGTADRDGDGDITVDELYDYVLQKVIEERPQQRPKMDASVSGRTVVAQNINWSLPSVVRDLLRNQFADVRLQGLRHLDDYFRRGNQAVRRNICQAVEELRDNEDSRGVEKAANDWLDEHRMACDDAQPVDVTPKAQPPKVTEEPEHAEDPSTAVDDELPEQSISEPEPPQERSSRQPRLSESLSLPPPVPMPDISGPQHSSPPRNAPAAGW